MYINIFFIILFILFTLLYLTLLFFPNSLESSLHFLHLSKSINFDFLTLFLLISSIFSFIGFLTTYFIEKKRVVKVKKERLNIEKIHAELKALEEN